MATLWRLSGQQTRDLNGKAFPAAKAYFYDAETNIPRAVYQDNALSTPHAHPVVADSQGRFPAVFLPPGLYREKVTTSGGVLVWDFDSIDASPTLVEDGGGGGGGGTTGYVTGDVIWRPTAGTRTGFVRLNGRTIGSAASGALERANADTAALFAYLWNGLADAQAPVSTGRGASAAADFAANKTITLPNARFGGLYGLADMGNSAVSVDAAVVIAAGGTATTPGASIGAQVHTLVLDETPAHEHDGVPDEVTVPDTGWGNSGGNFGTSTQGRLVVGSGGFESGELLESLRHSNGDRTFTLAGNEDTGSVGGGEAHNNMPPGLLGTFLIAL